MPDKIPNWINEICSIFPCMVVHAKDRGLLIDWGKVAQSLIVVAVITASTSFVTVKVLESRFDDLKYNVSGDIIELKTDFRELYLDNNKFKDDVAKVISEHDNKYEYRIKNLEDKIK